MTLLVSGTGTWPAQPTVRLVGQLMLGAVVSMRAIICLQVLVLPPSSMATHVRVATKVLPQVTFVTVLRMAMFAVPQALLAVGESNVRSPTRHSFVLFAEHAIIGPGFTTVTLVEHAATLRVSQGVSQKILQDSSQHHRIRQHGLGAGSNPQDKLTLRCG